MHVKYVVSSQYRSITIYFRHSYGFGKIPADWNILTKVPGFKSKHQSPNKQLMSFFLNLKDFLYPMQICFICSHTSLPMRNDCTLLSIYTNHFMYSYSWRIGILNSSTCNVWLSWILVYYMLKIIVFFFSSLKNITITVNFWCHINWALKFSLWRNAKRFYFIRYDGGYAIWRKKKPKFFLWHTHTH